METTERRRDLLAAKGEALIKERGMLEAKLLALNKAMRVLEEKEGALEREKDKLKAKEEEEAAQLLKARRMLTTHNIREADREHAWSLFKRQK